MYYIPRGVGVVELETLTPHQTRSTHDKNIRRQQWFLAYMEMVEHCILANTFNEHSYEHCYTGSHLAVTVAPPSLPRVFVKLFVKRYV